MSVIDVGSPEQAAQTWKTRHGDAGLLVVGHGTADAVGAEETRTVARLAAGLLPGVPVELGFLEVIGPSIDDACRALAARGCTSAVAAPLLLFTAGHARRDVPEALVEAARTHGIRVVQAEAFGCHPRIVELSRRRRDDALAGWPAVPPGETATVMVGRGSSAADALEQLRAFSSAARGTGDDEPLGFGFVAAARPTLEEALAEAVARQPRRIVVQPHLLFRGHVEQQVADAVDRYSRLHPHVEWIVVPRLGADRLVAAALVERATAAATAPAAGQTAAGGSFSAGKNVSPEPA